MMSEVSVYNQTLLSDGILKVRTKPYTREPFSGHHHSQTMAQLQLGEPGRSHAQKSLFHTVCPSVLRPFLCISNSSSISSKHLLLASLQHLDLWEGLRRSAMALDLSGVLTSTVYILSHFSVCCSRSCYHKAHRQSTSGEDQDRASFRWSCPIRSGHSWPQDLSGHILGELMMLCLGESFAVCRCFE